MKQFVVFIGLVSLFSIVNVSFAKEVEHTGPITRTGEQVTVDASQTLKGDFYAIAPSVIISGPAEHDAYLAGGTVTINAPIAGDLVILGGTVDVHGIVADDVRIIGGEVKIAEKIKGDLVVLGGTVEILSTGSVDGDILFQATTLRVDGPVAGGIHGTAVDIRINSTVKKDILVGVHETLSIGDKAVIEGSITYESTQEFVRAQNATIRGDVMKKDMAQDKMEIVRSLIVVACVILFGALSLYLICGSRMTRLCELLMTQPTHHGLVGICVTLAFPFIGVLLIFSQIGLWIGLIVLSLYLTGMLLAAIFVPFLVGFIIQKYSMKRSDCTSVTICIGVVATLAIAAVPYIGGLVLFGCLMVTMGALSSTLYHFIRS